MPLAAAALPNDIAALKKLVLAQAADIERTGAELAAAKAGLLTKTLEIEKLKIQIARLKRMISRANLDEESGNQGEDERIAERLDDRRWRCDSQGFLLCGVTWSVTPPLF